MTASAGRILISLRISRAAIWSQRPTPPWNSLQAAPSPSSNFCRSPPGRRAIWRAACLVVFLTPCIQQLDRMSGVGQKPECWPLDRHVPSTSYKLTTLCIARAGRGRYRDHCQADFSDRLSCFARSISARIKGCWRRRRASSPRAIARPFGLRGLTPASASNRGPPCDRYLDVAQQPIAIAGSKGLPVFRTPKHKTNSLRIAATTICLGLRRPRDFSRVTSATIAGLNRMADMAGI